MLLINYLLYSILAFLTLFLSGCPIDAVVYVLLEPKEIQRCKTTSIVCNATASSWKGTRRVFSNFLFEKSNLV